MPLILPPNQIIKPATISRRGFLRAMGVTATVIAVPSLVVPKSKTVIYGTRSEVYIGCGNGKMQFLGYSDINIQLKGKFYHCEQRISDAELDSLYPSIIRSHRNSHQLRDGREYPGVAETDPACGTCGG